MGRAAWIKQFRPRTPIADFRNYCEPLKKGRTVIVTSHGQPVAKISPIVEDERAAEGARSSLFARLRTERTVNAGRWTRDELYDDAR